MNGGHSFRDLLAEMNQQSTSPKAGVESVAKIEQGAFSEKLSRALSVFLDRWSSTEVRAEKVFKTLPTDARSYLGLQLEVNRLHLQSELLTKGAENLGSTLRRMQQLGNS